MAEMGGDRRTEMAMMNMAPTQLGITAVAADMCCQVSSSEIAPGPVRASVGAETSAVFMSQMPISGTLKPTKANAVCDHFPISKSPPQALLCIFLI
jgi:hypothetical protein